jgi:hypothetical protein
MGAINRTNAKTIGAEGRGQGHGQGGVTTEANSFGGQGRGQGGNGWGQPGRDDAAASQPGAGLAQADGVMTLQGAVASVDQDALVVKTGDGQEVTVEGRPWLYAQEARFTAQVGDQINLTGFDDGSKFEVMQMQNKTNGQSVVLRDETGRPGWAGRGRRNGG